MEPKTSLTPQEAFLGITLGAIWADDKVVDAERTVLGRGLKRNPLFHDLDQEAFDQLVQAAVDRARETDDPHAFYAECGRHLTTEQATAAYALAADIVLADGDLTPKEQSFLRTLGTLLGLDDDTVTRVLEVTWTRNLPLKGLTPIAPEPLDPDDEDVSLEAWEAYLGITLAAIWADGDEGLGEAVRGADGLRDLPELAPLLEGKKGWDDLVRHAERRMTLLTPRGFLQACADALEPEQRLQAYTLAADVVLADRDLTPEEENYMASLAERLGLPETEAHEALHVMWLKNWR